MSQKPSADSGVQALLQLGKNAEAETELLSIASSDNAPLELCTSALAAMLEAPGLCGTVASAAALILNRHPGLAQLPVQLVELILNRADSKARAALPIDVYIYICSYIYHACDSATSIFRQRRRSCSKLCTRKGTCSVSPLSAAEAVKGMCKF